MIQPPDDYFLQFEARGNLSSIIVLITIMLIEKLINWSNGITLFTYID